MKISDSEITQKLKSKKYFAIDLDGTIYLGQRLIPGTLDFLNGLRQKEKKFIFLTNNSSKNPLQYQQKLVQLGIQVEATQVYTSGDATIEYLRQQQLGERIFILGTSALRQQFQDSGFRFDANQPDVVVLGFDLTFNYEKLNQACDFIRKGLPFIATHPDFNCPLEEGKMLPDCGALSAAITAATGVKPTVIGKPNLTMLTGILSRFKCQADELVLIGDRLMTDIQMGKNFNIPTILVLSGETHLPHLKQSPILPDLIVQKTLDILNFL